jgi:carbon-monoxide dehydrogenase medium subunit
MKPAPFEYTAPTTPDAALALKAEHGDDAKILAGGQSLIPAMNFRLAQPARLIDLNHVAELDYIRAEADEVRIGAMTRQRRVERDPLVAAWAPLLHEALPFVAHPQIRNRGTLGGSLAHADPAAELPVVAIALGARVQARSAAGQRWIPAREFIRGIFTTDLGPEEVLVEIAIPRQPARTGAAFMEVARRQGDYAMAGVAALVTLDGSGVCSSARLVYLNVGDGPVDATQSAALLVGQTLTEEAIDAAAATASDNEIEPLGSIHASPGYQRHLTRVLTRRAVNVAMTRALSNGNG